MKGFGWLRKLRDNERGNALIIGAAVMPLLLGAAGLAVDTIQLGVWKRQLQRAADSSSVAGVYALTQGETPSVAVSNDLAQNFYPTLSTPQSVTVGPRAGFQQTVRVQLTSQRRLPFMSIFMGTASTIEADATAALVQSGRFCVLSLYNGTQTGVDVGGNANINLGCGVASNSRSLRSVEASGSSLITASPIMSVGGLDGASNNFADGTQLQPYSAEQTDPFASVPNPAPDPSSCTTSINLGPHDVRTEANADEICVLGADIKGTWNLGNNGGRPRTIYIYGGDLSFGSQSNVSCTGCTFVLTGPSGAAGNIDMNGQATLNLTAPTSGTYQNLLFYRDRRASNVQITINGGSNAFFQGALYFPSSDVRMNGHAGFQTRCFQLVGQILTFRGTADLQNSCPASTGGNGFELQYVRLVG